jgi:hypothetical protein
MSLSIHRLVFEASQLRRLTLWMLFCYPAGLLPGRAAVLRHGPQARSRGAFGAARSALALDGVEDPWLNIGSNRNHPNARRTSFSVTTPCPALGQQSTRSRKINMLHEQNLITGADPLE